MRILEVNPDNVSEFISYCRKYAKEQDESYIPRDDFNPGKDEHPYLLINDHDDIIGSASLMLQKEYRDNKKGRFRIFHCLEKSIDNYRMLFNSILLNCAGIENIYCFITDDKTDVRKIWEELGFKIKRYSWVLEKEITDEINKQFPGEYKLRNIETDADDLEWCNIINAAFADIEGHTHMLPERIDEMRKEKEYLLNGMSILWKGENPAGLVKLIKLNEDDKDFLFIETIAVNPEFQGRGLGRALLNYGVNFGKEMGLKKAMLTVNSENENATKLYFNEGFKKTEVFICYNKVLQ